MLDVIARKWWTIALRGACAIVFGILALVWPLLTLITLVFLFGAFALVDGIFAIIAGITSHQTNKRWWALLIGGVAGVIIGLLTFFWPGISALLLLSLIAIWAIITGVFEIVAAIQLRRLITGEWMMITGGILSIIFGLLIIILPGPGALSLVWLIGVYAIAFGISLIFLAFRLRKTACKAKATAAS